MRHLVVLPVLGLMSLAVPAFAQTAPPVWPAPPQVTVGVNLKEMIFDWDPVPGAVNYRLLIKPSDSNRVYYQPLGERTRRTRIAIPIAVHQQKWEVTRYVVLACNLAGCTRSAEIFPRDLMLDAIGYLKASNTDAGDRLGAQIAISADGSTLAVGAEGESSNATGVNGNASDDSSPNSGAVYVYRRNGRAWAQEAYIKAPVNEAQSRFGGSGVAPYRQRTLALSADGATLLVGSPSATVLGEPHAGIFHLYKRDTGNHWSLSFSENSPFVTAEDFFGYSVDLASDGRTIKVSSIISRYGPGEADGFTHIWFYNGTGWSYRGPISPYYPGDRCPASRMSTDGRTLVSVCITPGFVMRAVTLRRQQFTDNWIYLNTWSVDFYNENPRIAINHQGTQIAISLGHRGIQLLRWQNSAWADDGNVLEWRVTAPTEDGWDASFDFSRTGNWLAIADPTAIVAGAGVSDRVIEGESQVGALILYKRVPESVPSWQVATIAKAPNPGAGDRFGASVALGGEGWYLAVGAPGEDSAATGVDGNQTSNSAADAGAAYLY
jgi:hypothetical protein